MWYSNFPPAYRWQQDMALELFWPSSENLIEIHHPCTLIWLKWHHYYRKTGNRQQHTDIVLTDLFSIPEQLACDKTPQYSFELPGYGRIHEN